MKRAGLPPKNAPRRSKAKTPRYEDNESEEIYFPYAQCLCDLYESDDGTRLDLTLGHVSTCPQLRLDSSKPTKTFKSPSNLSVYPEFEGDAQPHKGRRRTYDSDKRKEIIRRRQKEERRLRDVEARLETLKAAQRPSDPYAQCHCGDALSDSEEDALREQSRIFYHGYTDGDSIHSPRCRKGRLDYIMPRGPNLSPPKSTSYIDLDETETIGSGRKKKRTARQPPKSKEYIDLEDEDEEEYQGSGSTPAIRYDPKTIASDFLRAIGKHPHLPPLNAHMERFSTNTTSRSSKISG